MSKNGQQSTKNNSVDTRTRKDDKSKGGAGKAAVPQRSTGTVPSKENGKRLAKS